MNLALVGEGENQGAEKRSIAWLKAATLLVLWGPNLKLAAIHTNEQFWVHGYWTPTPAGDNFCLRGCRSQQGIPQEELYKDIKVDELKSQNQQTQI